MKKSKNLLIFAILATMMFCAAICRAQVKQENVQIIDRLEDGSVIVAIDGVKYRALTAEQLRQIQMLAVSNQSCVKENQTLTEQNGNLKTAVQKMTQDLLTADAQTNNERRRGDEFKQLYEDERKLRLEAEKLPKKKNIFEKILNHPITQVVLVGAAGVIAAQQK